MAWRLQPFLAKFLTAQGSAIIALLDMKVSDPWQWLKIGFFGLIVAVGVDTATFMVAQKKGGK